jgi:hypothetical protein
MKKIIAAAVAAAFVAPAFAADVTISGDVEFVIENYKGDGTSGDQGDADITVTATEEANGIAITAYIENEAGTQDAAVSFAGEFGTVKVGNDAFDAGTAVDEVADKAEFGLGASNMAMPSTMDLNVMWTLPSLVDGLNVMVSQSYAAGTNDTSTTNENSATAYGLTYSLGAIAVSYGVINDDSVTYEPAHTNISFTSGPIFVAAAQTENDGAVNTDSSSLSAVYNYGGGNLYAEQQTVDTNGTKASNTGVGVSYKIGGANVYVQSISGDTETENGSFVGVEYAF